MTGPRAAQESLALAGPTMPPWLWVWLVGYLPFSAVGVISVTPQVVASYSSLSAPSLAGAKGPLLMMLPYLIFAVLVYLTLFAGTVVVVFPQLRGRRVERRFKLTNDDRPVIAEMQRFVSSHDPSIQLRFSLRADQMARIYPVGWRSARIAVFRPLAVLWRRDREAAQAILLHEVAHRRKGDQLIMGLGSPFVWLLRIGVPAYLLLVLIPAGVYLAVGGGTDASYSADLGVSLAALIPAMAFLPVIALWLAEFDADQLAARAIGSGALQRALAAGAGPRVPPVARAGALLSHPPGRLRLRHAVARPAGAAALIAVWPAALVVFSLILPFVIDAPIPEPGLSPSMRGIFFKEYVQLLLGLNMPATIATAVGLLAWPALAAPWERLWSSGPRRGRHQPWWPCLAAASLPVGMLLLLFLPPFQTSQAGIDQALLGSCAPAADWLSGQDTGSDVPADYAQLAQAGNNKTEIAAAVHRLDAAVQAALDDPPPGAARSSYMQAMAGYRTAGQEFTQGSAAATNTMVDATDLFTNALTMVEASALRCNSTGSQFGAG